MTVAPEAADRAPRARKLALHQRISAELAERIHSGAWPPGCRIPIEHDLMRQYGCARATANKAVRALADAGLIERRRRAGSFVRSPRVQAAVLDIPELEAEVLRRGQVYGWAMISRRPRPLDVGVAEESSLSEPGTDVLEIVGLHLAGGVPFASEQRLINLAVVPEAADVDFAVASPGAWLLDNVPWSEAEHRISALGADRAVAERLQLACGDPCLRLDRWTWRGGDGVTFVRQICPAETFELVARFAPKSFR